MAELISSDRSLRAWVRHSTAKAGIENAQSIVAMPGVDGVWLGHFDLSLSLGIPGEFEHPRYTEAVDHLVEVSRRHGKPLGQMIRTVQEGAALRERGLQVLAYADVGIFEDALKERLDRPRESL